MKFDRVMWDFNGTVLDDLDVGIKSANTLLARHGLPQLSGVEAYYSVFGFPIIDYYRRLGFDFSRLSFSELANEWVDIYLENVSAAPARRGIKNITEKISLLGIKQTLFSMTETNMLMHQLSLISMENSFDEIVGKDDIYASGKLALAKKWAESHIGENILYIGDTTHDAESAEIIGAKCILISGGHESKETLLGSGLPVIDSIYEVENYIK